MTSNTAPIALFTYNRPWHTKRTIEALLNNVEAKDSNLIIYSDAARGDDNTEAVNEVRRYIHAIQGFKSVRVIEREKNFGLAQSIITGVTEIVEEYGRIIVLEDDMVTSPYFLKYMNDGLELYANKDKVISIHAYSFPVEDLPETFFIKGASCWGWATWKRGWDLFEADGKLLFDRLREAGLMDRFNLYGAYPYKKMLLDQIHGKNNSWAVRWYASALLKGKLSLHPGCSLVANIGLDGSGTHCGSHNAFDTTIAAQPVHVSGIEVVEHEDAFIMWQGYFNSLKVCMLQRVFSKLKRILGRAM